MDWCGGYTLFYILVVNAKVRTSTDFQNGVAVITAWVCVGGLILYGQFEISGGDDVGRGSYSTLYGCIHSYYIFLV